MRLLIRAIIAIVFVASIALSYLYFTINDYQLEGELQLSVLDAPVTVRRDQLSTPYIEAQSLADALRAQGFIIGQERLYQAQLFRLLALGRLSEVFGEKGIRNDTLVRLVNLDKVADDYLQALDAPGREFYTHYIEGLNAYILEHEDEHPLAVKLLNMPQEAWSLRDIVTLQIFQAWSTSSLWRNELLTQQLIDEVGLEKAQQIAQVSVNPNDGSVKSAQLINHSLAKQSINPQQNEALISSLSPHYYDAIPDSLAAGSNAWATGSRKSLAGKPIFANNPHLPATTLPGFWLPMGLFTPNFRAVGVTAPGSPGIGVGRTQHIAYGATVGGGDGVDLYIEQLDPNVPDHYLQGNDSLPLSIRQASFKVKDKTQPTGFRTHTLRIRSTKRGPLISDHGITATDQRAISIAWAMVGTQSASLGSDRLLVAKNVSEARAAIQHFPASLSHVVVDENGGVARISAGRIPVRTTGDGARPLDVQQLNSKNFKSWNGLIPHSEMPIELNPERDWVGTANHRIVSKDYPYEFSKDFAAAWRYRRIKQVMQNTEKLSVEDHWQLINDIHNPMADKLVPLFASVLKNHKDYGQLSETLLQWDHKDSADQVAPTLFQQIHNHLARLTFGDEMPNDLAVQFFDSVRFWQERLILMLDEPKHPWFDIQSTPEIETRDQILAMAVDAALAELQNTLGHDPSNWQWGKLHTITFDSPVIPGKLTAKWLGGGTHPMFGSGQTLNRGKYLLSQPYITKMIDSVRLVADLSDTEKIRVVIPGGASGRYFNGTLDNQVDDWLAGRYNPIWFNLDRVRENTQTELHLVP